MRGGPAPLGLLRWSHSHLLPALVHTERSSNSGVETALVLWEHSPRLGYDSLDNFLFFSSPLSFYYLLLWASLLLWIFKVRHCLFKVLPIWYQYNSLWIHITRFLHEVQPSSYITSKVILSHQFAKLAAYSKEKSEMVNWENPLVRFAPQSLCIQLSILMMHQGVVCP